MITIKSKTDLQGLLADNRSQKELTKLEIKGLSDDELLSWQIKLNSFVNECGCSLGAKFMFAFVAIYLAIIVVWPDLIVQGLLYKILIGIAIFFSGAIIGKVIGIKMAKINFRKSCKQLMVKLDE
jgi:hypothetical protein